MKIFVTGAGGQIGRELIVDLRSRNIAVVATDKYPDPQLGIKSLDVTDLAAVSSILSHHQPDCVFHLAAVLSAKGEASPLVAYDTNMNGTWNVFEASRIAGVRQVLFASTIAVYGPGTPDPAHEDVPLAPTTIYGITKVAGELLGQYYARRYGMDFRCARLPGLISASKPGGGVTDYAVHMYFDCVNKGRYQAFCRDDTRIPLMYLADAIRGLVGLTMAPVTNLSRQVYNLASFSPTAAELAGSIRSLVPQAKIDFVPDPAKQSVLDSWPQELDDRKAREDWGWDPQFSIEETSADMVARIQSMTTTGGTDV